MKRSTIIAGATTVGGLLVSALVPKARFWVGAAIGAGVGASTALLTTKPDEPEALPPAPLPEEPPMVADRAPESSGVALWDPRRVSIATPTPVAPPPIIKWDPTIVPTGGPTPLKMPILTVPKEVSTILATTQRTPILPADPIILSKEISNALLAAPRVMSAPSNSYAMSSVGDGKSTIISPALSLKIQELTKALYSKKVAVTGEPPGWLGMILGYGSQVRYLAMKWMYDRTACSPFNREGESFGDWEGSDVNYFNQRVEPIPPRQGSAATCCFDTRGSDWTSLVGMKSFKYFSGGGDEYTDAFSGEDGLYPKVVAFKVLRSPFLSYEGRGWFKWTEHSEWGFDYITDSPKGKILELPTLPPGRKVWMPSWYHDEVRAAFGSKATLEMASHKYLTRVRRYYRSGYWLVWAAACYAIHVLRDQDVPWWFRRHCRNWGVPFPSQRIRGDKNRRYFTDAVDEGSPPIPVSIYGTSTGTSIPRSDVEHLLALVVQHAPEPGAAEEILPGSLRRVIDWPDDVLSFPASPSWECLPRPGEEAYGNEELIRDIVQTVVGIGMSVAGSVSGSSGMDLGALSSTLVQSATLLCEFTTALVNKGAGNLGYSDLWNSVAKVTSLASGGETGFLTEHLVGLGDSMRRVDQYWPHTEQLLGAVTPISGEFDPGGLLGKWSTTVQQNVKK